MRNSCKPRCTACQFNDGRRYSIKAIGIPSISEEVTAVQMSEITELLGLKNEKLRRGKGQVDLLIGIDHAHMHTGESKQAGQLVARSTLGWVVLVVHRGKCWKPVAYFM